jgi:hypothetical protein
MGECCSFTYHFVYCSELGKLLKDCREIQNMAIADTPFGRITKAQHRADQESLADSMLA